MRVEVKRSTPRRLWVLLSQLPVEAALWRDKAWPSNVEFEVLGIERFEVWAEALLSALLNHKRINHPGRMRFVRPGEEQEQERKRAQGGRRVDPERVLSFFGRLGRKGH